MKPIATIGLAAGGLAVADHLIRGGFSSAGRGGDVERDEGHAAAVSAAAGAELPCDAERDADDVREGTDARREWSIQNAALGATLGATLGRPKLTAKCAAEWIAIWLDAWKEAVDEDRDRYRVTSDSNPFSPGEWRPALLGFNLTAGLPRSALGSAWEALRELHAEASAEDSDETWISAPEVSRTLREFADQLDAAGSAPEEESALLKFLKRGNDNRRKAMRMVGEGIGLVVESTVAPIADGALTASLATLGSAAAPYLILGGLGYLAWRRR